MRAGNSHAFASRAGGGGPTGPGQVSSATPIVPSTSTASSHVVGIKVEAAVPAAAVVRAPVRLSHGRTPIAARCP